MSDDSKDTDNLENKDSLPAEGSFSAEGSLPVEDSLQAEGSLQAEDSLQVDDSLQAEGSSSAEDSLPAEGSEILASLKQLKELEAEQVSIHALTPEVIKNIVEASILAASKAISIDKLVSLFSENEVVEKNQVRQAIEQLTSEYQSRGVELIEVSSGFRFQVTQTAAPWVSRLWEERPQKYSRALLETLALVAYRQPVTRGEIEEIRGVSVSSQIMRTLVEREWVRIIGHRDVPGKPAMYATTKTFLDYFGLKKLEDLPPLSEIRDLDVINAELDFGDQKNGDQKNGDQNSDDQDKDEQVKNDHADTGLNESVDAMTSEGDPEPGISVSVDSDQIESIDIDAELNALRETYQKIDEIEIKTESEDSSDRE